MEESDAVRCNQCGSLLFSSSAGEPKCASSLPPPPPLPDPKKQPPERRKLTPAVLLASDAARIEVRVKMLCAVPGITKAKALAVVVAFPSFEHLMAASREELAAVVVRKGTLGDELGDALYSVLH